MALRSDQDLKCIRLSGGTLSYHSVYASTLDGLGTTVAPPTTCTATIYNQDGTTFAGPFTSAAGALTSTTNGETTWALNLAHSSVTSSVFMHHSWDAVYRVEFTGTSTGPTVVTVVNVWVTVNNQDYIAEEYPGELYASGLYGDNSSAYSGSQEFGTASKSNPAREGRTMLFMSNFLDIKVFRMRDNFSLNIRTNTYNNILFKGWPTATMPTRSGNTANYDECAFEDIELEGPGTVNGDFQMTRGGLNDGFVHTNGEIVFIDEPLIRGDLRALSSTKWLGKVRCPSTPCKIDVGNAINEITLEVTQGILQLDGLSTAAVNINGVGSTLRLEAGNTETGGTVDVSGFVRVQDDSGTEWDGTSAIGNVTITQNKIASETTVLTDLVDQQGPGQWDAIAGTSTGLAFVVDDDNASGTDPLQGVSLVGSVSSGTYADVRTEDGTYLLIDAVGNEIDYVAHATVPVSSVPLRIDFAGYLQGPNDTCLIQAYDFVASGWETRSTLQGAGAASNITPSIPLGEGRFSSALGDVYVRFHSTATNNQSLGIDRLVVGAESDDLAIIKGMSLGNYVLDGGAGAADVDYDEAGHAAVQRVRVFASSAATSAATLGAADGADSEIARVDISSAPKTDTALPRNVTGLLT